MSYFTKPLLITLALGFFSGLPLALTAGTLTFWLAESHIDKAAIGLFAAVATPYTLKFLWSPLMDSVRMPVLCAALGRRRGWMVATQLALVAAIVLLSFSAPAPAFWQGAALCAFLLAFASASQDIVIDAYRVEILTPQEQGQGAAMVQLGYRMGILLSGAGALWLADRLSWQETYLTMALVMGAGLLVTLLADEPQAPQEVQVRLPFAQWLAVHVAAPFADFMRRPGWGVILLFVICYKLADAFIGIMSNPFFYELGFTKTQIAELVKVYGTIATLLGTFLGGSLTARFGPLRILFIAGLLHGLTNLLYVLQARMGADAALLAVSISVENFTGGISAAAFVAYLSNLCNRHYTATQYALLSSVAALGRTWLATPSGLVAKWLGWQGFFTFGALLALPGLMLIYVLKKRFPTAPRPAS